MALSGLTRSGAALPELAGENPSRRSAMLGIAGSVGAMVAPASLPRKTIPLARTSGLRSIEEFRQASDSDYTEAFASASRYSSDTGEPVILPPAAQEYEVSTPIRLGPNASFMGSSQPTYGPEAVLDAHATVIQPSASFPSDHALIEITSDGRGTALSGFALRGRGRGSHVSGIRLPGSAGVPELGLKIEDIVISGFTGNGIDGGARVTHLDTVYITENAGWGINMEDPWFDSRWLRVYAGWNRLGGVNIDSPTSLLTVAQSRFERSGQVYDDPQKAASTSTAAWNSRAPGLRIRGGNYLSFVQVETDANTGPGVEIETDNADPMEKTGHRPSDISFTACVFSRDGQAGGSAKPASQDSVGVLLRGYDNTSKADVYNIDFSQCRVTAGFSNDSGAGPFSAPDQGVHMSGTRYVSWSGGTFNCVHPFVFGEVGQDPTELNWQPSFSIPAMGLMTMPSDQVAPPFTMRGLIRYNTSKRVVETHGDTDWAVQAQ